MALVSLGVSTGCGRGTGSPPDTDTDGSGGSESSASGNGSGTTSGSAGDGGQGGETVAGPFVDVNPNCEPRVASGDTPMIDDFEDGDDLLDGSEGRDGGWWASHDDTGGTLEFAIEELAEPRDGSEYAMHASGSGMIGWGAVSAATLRANAESDSEELEDTGCPYDASVYQGIRFWARGEAGQLRVKATLLETIPVSYGGICAAVPESECWNDHSAPLAFTDEWEEYSIRFDDLMQDPTWGIETEFDPKHINAIRFQNDAWEEFDYWIDDLTFF